MYVYIYPHTHTEGETCIPESVYGVEFMLYLKFYISLFYYFFFLCFLKKIASAIEHITIIIKESVYDMPN